MKKVGTVSAVLLALAIAPQSAMASTNGSWNSSTPLKGSVTIPVGTTITVEAGTKLAVGSGVRITVLGTLLAPNGLTLSGSSWDGLVVLGKAELTNFVETGAGTPFRVGPAGSLTIHGGNISGVSGSSDVEGSLVADGLHYNKGDGGGINSNNGTGSISIDRSVLTGTGRNSGDFFGLYGAKSISLTNSEMTGAHCAFHVMGVRDMKLLNDNIHGNSYGFMMYGSADSGVKTITNTRITHNLFGFDEGSAATHNGVIVISNSAISHNGQNLGLYTGKVKIVHPLN